MSFHTQWLLAGLLALFVSALAAGSVVFYLVRYRTTHAAQAPYLPTPRGAVALFLSVMASLFYPAVLPGRVSTLGDWQFGWPVSPIARVIGVVLVFACVAACVEAFRRGSWMDRALACASAYFTYIFIHGVFKSYFYSVAA